MDRKAFEGSPSGKLVSTEREQWAFVPNELPVDLGRDVTAALSKVLAEASAAIGELNGIGRLLQDPYLLIRPLQAQEALTSSSMEGTYTTLNDLLFVEAGADESLRSPDTREVLNYRIALSEAIASLEKVPLSLRTLRNAHARLLGGVSRHRGASVRAGEFKQHQNFIGAYDIGKARFVPPPPGDHTTRLLGNLERYIHRPDDATHPLIDSALLHYQFETIHPFADGNGRVGRMLITLHLFSAGVVKHPILYLSPTLEGRKDEYIDRMFNVSKTGDWEGWIRFYLKAMKDAALDAIDTADRLRAVDRDYRDRLQTAGRSANLLRIVELLFASPVLSIPRIADHLGVTYHAARKNVETLVKVGVLEENTKTTSPRLYIANDIMTAITGNSHDA